MLDPLQFDEITLRALIAIKYGTVLGECIVDATRTGQAVVIIYEHAIQFQISDPHSAAKTLR